MPIEYLPGVKIEPDDESENRAQRHREEWRAAIRAGSIHAAICAAPSALVLVLAISTMRTSLISAGDLLRQGQNWFSAFMPALLFLLFGLGLGCLLGWRLADGVGLTGRAGLIVGAAAVAGIVAVGAVAVVIVFVPVVPSMAWTALGAVGAGALPGLCYFCIWAA